MRTRHSLGLRSVPKMDGAYKRKQPKILDILGDDFPNSCVAHRHGQKKVMPVRPAHTQVRTFTHGPDHCASLGIDHGQPARAIQQAGNSQDLRWGWGNDCVSRAADYGCKFHQDLRRNAEDTALPQASIHQAGGYLMKRRIHVGRVHQHVCVQEGGHVGRALLVNIFPPQAPQVSQMPGAQRIQRTLAPARFPRPYFLRQGFSLQVFLETKNPGRLSVPDYQHQGPLAAGGAAHDSLLHRVGHGSSMFHRNLSCVAQLHCTYTVARCQQYKPKRPGVINERKPAGGR